MYQGYLFRHDRDMERLAWQTAHLMNIHLKRKVTVKKLLEKDRRQSKQTKEQNFKKLMKRLGEKAGD